MAISGSDSDTAPAAAATKQSPQAEVESVKCDSCGFTEDCTPPYILRVRERYNGRWICGLCAEAVKDEVLRSSDSERLISIEEALDRHISFYNTFRSTAAETEHHPIFALGKILRKSLDSPRPPPLRSRSTSILLPHIKRVKGSSISRSESCSTLSR